jgi:hypothetical protein
MAILFLFIDGLGIGRRGPHNPFSRVPSHVLSPLGGDRGSIPCGGRMVPLDATLGVPGLPQSATGQTSLLTGVNAQGLLGRHLQGFPNATLRALIAGHGLLKRALAYGPAAFANAYTPVWFETKVKRRESVTTVMTRAAGLPLRDLEDLRAGRAVYQDFTNQLLIERGYDVPALSPEAAGERLAGLLKGHCLLLYEYFRTDLVGHTADPQAGEVEVKRLDAFLQGVLSALDLSRDLVLLTSDHGNLEDCGTPSHTQNPVPAFLWGDRPPLGELKAITDITPALLKVLEARG